jgi:hypothetical protein
MAAPQPFLLRIALGDIIDVQSSMVVVGHVNDVLPSGAEAAVDNLLGGAISQYIGPRRGRLGLSYLVPTMTSALTSPCVCVVSMGDGEELEITRLPELGAAIVQAASIVGARDAATVLLGAGSLDLRAADVARALISGALAEVARQSPATRLRELIVVERDPARLKEIQDSLSSVSSTLDLHIYLDEIQVRRTVGDAVATESSLVDHLRLGITRAGDQLKVTSIGDGAFDVAKLSPYPAEVAQRIAGNLHTEVLDEPDDTLRVTALDGLGAQLYHAFLEEAEVLDRLRDSPGGYVVLRLDESTVDLPWELLAFDDQQLALDKRFARQVELRTPGRQAAMVPRADKPSVLVIGDPTGDLPAAKREGEAVASALGKRGDADVDLLLGRVTYNDLSKKLNERCWDIVHYAGHARFDPLREDAGGLELADNQTFTAQDLGSRRYLPRLFVANACYSAATGDARLPDIGARSTRNLVTGVLAAGARGFVGAAWQVDDQAAATFATALYDELLSTEPAPRGTLGEAVRLGRHAIIDTHGPQQPAWAAYVLYGSPWKRAW